MPIAIDKIDYWTPPTPRYYESCPADWWKQIDDEPNCYGHKPTAHTPSLLGAFKAEFEERADRWDRETAVFSSPTSFYLNKDYMVITAKGIENPKEIVPLILNRLLTKGGDWFFALENIAGENPARDIVNYPDAVKAWEDWAKKQGFTLNR